MGGEDGMADGGGRARGAAFGELRRWTQSRHLGYWGRRALAFELVWRLAWSLVLIPVGYLLVNWYVDVHLTSPEMTNIGVESPRHRTADGDGAHLHSRDGLRTQRADVVCRPYRRPNASHPVQPIS